MMIMLACAENKIKANNRFYIKQLELNIINNSIKSFTL